MRTQRPDAAGPQPRPAAVETFRLASGRTCHLVGPRVPFGLPYRVLVFGEPDPGPNTAEQAEMLALALTLARRLAAERFGDPERYMLIHNGLGARRRRDFHCHVIPVSGRPEKTAVYLWLFLKNVAHPLWRLVRPLRRRWMRPATAGTQAASPRPRR